MSWDRSINDYLEELGSPSPAPGGGASSALAAAIGAAQLQMVVELTLQNSRYQQAWPQMEEHTSHLQALRKRFLELADEDAQGYQAVAAALKLPRNTPELAQKRTAVLEANLYAATQAPLAIMELAAQALFLCQKIAAEGTSMAASDVTVAAALLRSAIDGAAATTLANTCWMQDRSLAQQINRQLDQLRKQGDDEARNAMDLAEKGLRRD